MSPDDAPPVLFDAVVFDLDGTLVATERFWVEAARAGARRAFAELGLERPLPSPAEWLSMVGLPLTRGFELVFADLDPAHRAHVQARCVEEEEAALRAGGAALIDGARELLDGLRARGVQLGIASNCGRGYLETMLHGLGLAAWIREARCLDSAGVRDKADMVADLLATFGTRSAVMVGDRRGDAEAAHANGLPHVHLEGPIKPGAEDVPCEARVTSLQEVEGVLAGRARGLAETLRALGAGPGLRELRVLGVGGGPAAGKSLLARDLVRLVEHAGRPARAVALEGWRRGEEPSGRVDPLEGLEVEALVEDLLGPHREGRPVAAGPAGGAPLAPDELLVLEGAWVGHPRLRLALDKVLEVAVPEDVARARTAAGDGLSWVGAASDRLQDGRLPAWRAFERAFARTRRADLLLDGTNPLAPAPL